MMVQAYITHSMNRIAVREPAKKFQQAFRFILYIFYMALPTASRKFRVCIQGGLRKLQHWFVKNIIPYVSSYVLMS